MEVARVKSPPARPLMIFDGDCHFCSFWIERWKRATGEGVEYVPFQSPRVRAEFPELPRERLEKSVRLIEPIGTVYSGAEAVFRSLAVNPRRRLWLWMYQTIPGFGAVAEWGYRFIANHRTAFWTLTRLAIAYCHPRSLPPW